jgi:hypothetical protein
MNHWCGSGAFRVSGSGTYRLVKFSSLFLEEEKNNDDIPPNAASSAMIHFDNFFPDDVSV